MYKVKYQNSDKNNVEVLCDKHRYTPEKQSKISGNDITCDGIHADMSDNDNCAIVYKTHECNEHVNNYKQAQYYLNSMLIFLQEINAFPKSPIATDTFTTALFLHFTNTLNSLTIDPYITNSQDFWYNLISTWNGIHHEYYSRLQYKNECICVSNSNHNFWLQCLENMLKSIKDFMLRVYNQLVKKCNIIIQCKRIQKEFSKYNNVQVYSNIIGTQCSIEEKFIFAVYLFNIVGEPKKSYEKINNLLRIFMTKFWTIIDTYTYYIMGEHLTLKDDIITTPNGDLNYYFGDIYVLNVKNKIDAIVLKYVKDIIYDALLDKSGLCYSDKCSCVILDSSNKIQEININIDNLIDFFKNSFNLYIDKSDLQKIINPILDEIYKICIRRFINDQITMIIKLCREYTQAKVDPKAKKIVDQICELSQVKQILPNLSLLLDKVQLNYLSKMEFGKIFKSNIDKQLLTKDIIKDCWALSNEGVAIIFGIVFTINLIDSTVYDPSVYTFYQDTDIGRNHYKRRRFDDPETSL